MSMKSVGFLHHEESAVSAPRRAVLHGAVFAVPALLLVAYCLAAAPRIPVWDSWSWILWLQRIKTGEIGFVGLFLLTHIEHPYGFPTSVFVYLGSLWDYSLRPMAAISTLVIVVNAAILSRNATQCGVRSLVVLLGIAAVSLSLRQYENVLFGFQLGFPLTVLFGRGAVTAAASMMRADGMGARSLALAICLLCGSTSSAASFAMYPAVALTFTLFCRRPPVVGLILVVASAALWLNYYVPVITAIHIGRPALVDIAKGLFTLAGSPLFESLPKSLATGLVVIVCFAFFAWKRRRGTDAERLMIATGLLSLGFIGILACGRGDMGGINPPRYSTFAVPLVVATIALAVGRLDYHWQRRVALPLIILIGYCTIVAAKAALAQARLTGADAEVLTQIILNHRTSSDADIAKINPGSPELIRGLVTLLEQNRWNVFSR